jgi:holo-[acyl-carrier protein] synthase
MTTIIGHGVDIVELADFGALVEHAGTPFLNRCFTAGELAYAGDGPNRSARLAARFAAKEAVLKAIGTGWTSGTSWRDIEVLHHPTGAPSINISGAVARIAADKGITGFQLSLSHTRTLAAASVIAVCDASPQA